MAVNIHDLEREFNLGGKVIRRHIRSLNLGARQAGLTTYSWEDNSASLKLIRQKLASLANGKPAAKPASNGKMEAVAAASPANGKETGLFLANASGTVNGFHKVNGAAQAAPGTVSSDFPVDSPVSGQSASQDAATPSPEASPVTPGKAKRSKKQTGPTSTRPLADINQRLPISPSQEETSYLRGYQIKELQPGHKLECEICLDKVQLHTKALFLALLKPKRWANVCLEHCREQGIGPALARGESIEGYDVAEILRTRHASSAH